MSQTPYNPKAVEKKWQKFWLETKLYKTHNTVNDKKNKYILVEFPYPSGDGLHVGHVKNYTATDVYARFCRLNGFNVLHPMGWDAFGLPTENSAIKYKVHPAELTRRNISHFRQQMQMMGLSYDWDREINTTDPAYYKWTQWIFLQLYKRGLAYEATVSINWCPSCKTGLANEEVIAGKCERCNSPVSQKPIRQWLLKITAYAEQLLAGLDSLDWPEFIKDIQRNWIGKSYGSTIDFPVKELNEKLKIFTTRPETIFGATYMVVAPEHPFVKLVVANNLCTNKDEVQSYIQTTLQKTDLQRQEDEKEKNGIELKGVYATNPATKEKIPIWLADYVLMSYGTGAIMSVPAHDQRDYMFAKKYNLPIKQVIKNDSSSELPFEGSGLLINSGEFSGQQSDKTKELITKEVGGTQTIQYKLRDWVFSRQRYWGEPFPLIHCPVCGVVPVPEDQLPVELPVVESYEPTGTGESPLAAITDWVETTCPVCGHFAKRETNTMPQWAGSSWYWIRFIDPGNTVAMADPGAMAQWLPVDVYVGGAEHAVLHLLYGRFWNMVLHDAGIVNSPEPFTKRHIVGIVLGADGQKMSKSRGNVVNPDDEVRKYGADTVRIFSMFMGPFGGSASWTTEGIMGSDRFVKRVWVCINRLIANPDNSVPEDLQLKVQQTILRVTQAIEQFKFNTAVAALMELLNVLEKKTAIDASVLEIYIILMSPFTPHLSEELWQQLGHETSITLTKWPVANRSVLKAAAVTIPVQVNGRVRGTVTVSPGLSQDSVVSKVKKLSNVQKYLRNTEIRRIIFIPDKLINFVVG